MKAKKVRKLIRQRTRGLVEEISAKVLKEVLKRLDQYLPKKKVPKKKEVEEKTPAKKVVKKKAVKKTVKKKVVKKPEPLDVED
jgi:hypothetical protein